ncbi:hypothetical protein FNV43_RR03857 [Rhamnella rubrinervis]|uniref:Stigma-specific STIG1-like protein 1 n=1 Tax=Rhamnella rubrinervis TaxID=2594499 RepID=A0A8K0HIQ8_9ROSA|nr:hypothetical protein FNV43_RR03857 [Rhamnella rubrinervis]
MLNTRQTNHNKIKYKKNLLLLIEKKLKIDVHELLSGGRSLRQKKKQTLRLTCKTFPRICRFKGSPGPNCCKKKCVNVLTDRFNCGRCGKKCKFSKICCNGKCVNPSFNSRHCGGCNNSCSNGGICAFGLCNYA